MTISVLQPGLLTTVQDSGRYGLQDQGVPVCGAMDTTALRCANMLVCNDDGAAALEITIIGPTLRFDMDAIVALTGADLNATLGDIPFPSWHMAFAPAGSTLSFRGNRTGCHTYLAVAGGIDVPPVLGSRSTYIRGSFGGHKGRSLRSGDALATGQPRARAAEILAAMTERADRTVVSRWGIGPSLRRAQENAASIRLVDGSHTHLLEAESRHALLSEEFRISPSSDRMGYRLLGPRLNLSRKVELLSEGVTLGTVQLPPGGNPIVLMADRQTTGGYPRIGEVATADIGKLAQLRPGDAARFSYVSVEEAQRLYRALENDLALLRAAVALRFAEPRSLFPAT